MTNIQQEIYERYMNSFSEEISELNTLDFDTLTRDMHDLYIKMCKVSKKRLILIFMLNECIIFMHLLLHL